MQNVQSFYVFTAFGGGNEKNTKYDGSCRVDRHWNYWTCPWPDDGTITKECSKPLDAGGGGLPPVESCKKDCVCKDTGCKAELGRQQPECYWQCKDRLKSTDGEEENKGCDDADKVCGKKCTMDFACDPKKVDLVIAGMCPEGCT